MNKIQAFKYSPQGTPGFSFCLLFQGCFYPSSPSPNLISNHVFAESLGGNKLPPQNIHLSIPTPCSLLYESLTSSLPLPKDAIFKNFHIPQKRRLYFIHFCAPRTWCLDPRMKVDNIKCIFKIERHYSLAIKSTDSRPTFLEFKCWLHYFPVSVALGKLIKVFVLSSLRCKTGINIIPPS